jgi:predicted acylesterase/phospholipase RssA
MRRDGVRLGSGPVAVAVSFALLAAGRAAAAPSSHPTTSSITVSGGVSLGAYEAGFLFYTLTAAQHDRAVDLRLLTGASAGSLNALVAVLTACGPTGGPPTRSLFWSTWIPVGFDQMFTPEGASPLGVFSRDWLERGGTELERIWNEGIDPGCDVVLGISATRAEPRVLQAAAGRLELPQMEEKFALRVRGRGPGRPPRVTNYVPAREPRPGPLLVTDQGGEVPFSELRDLVLASMSFPVAFPPQPLRTCTVGDTATPGVCLPAEARTALYVDGGVFDNAPLRLAVSLARSGLRELPGGGRLGWREVPEPGVRVAPVDVSFTFVDPSATEYPAPAVAAEQREREPSLTRELGALLASFVATARSKELAVLLEEHPEIADRLLMPRRRFPAAGAPLLAFLGFFEAEFRVFDFHLGMYDARRMLEEAAAAPGGSPVRLPEPAGSPDPGWEPLRCMRAVFDGGDAAEACRSHALSDFRVLLQVSLDQLYDACSAPRPEEAERWRNPHCERAARGEPPPRVPGVAPRDGRWPSFHRGVSESELAYSMRLLAAYGFRFRDLHVPSGRGDLAVDRIRGALGRAAGALAAAQPWRERVAVGFAAKLAADSVTYAPPDHVFHLTLGPTEAELGLSRGFFQSRLPRGLRLATALGFRGLDEALSAGKSEPFALVATGGIEWQPPPGRSTLAQLRLGLRGGWLFAADDGYGAGPCLDRGSASVSACSRPVVQALVGVTALERVRVQVVGEWFPGTATRAALWSIAPGIGFELGY